MRDLTPRQREYLQAFRRHIVETGHAPTVREFGAYIGVRSSQTAFAALSALETKGYLVAEAGDRYRAYRGWRLAHDDPREWASHAAQALAAIADATDLSAARRLAAAVLARHPQEGER